MTHALDKGMPVEQLRSLMGAVAEYVDLWKFGWGLSYMDPEIAEKVQILADHGVKGCPGGTLLEISWAQDRTSEFFEWAASVGFPCVEVSNGATGMPVETKRELIGEANQRGFEVLSEVGSKDPGTFATPDAWVAELQGDAAAGAAWLVAEGRESGTVGLYTPTGDVRCDLVKAIHNSPSSARLIYEAPRRSQQAWLLQNLGPHVNLGNIVLDELHSVESMRRGLRSDTLELMNDDGRMNDDGLMNESGLMNEGGRWNR